jgi:hypothetical protein
MCTDPPSTRPPARTPPRPSTEHGVEREKNAVLAIAICSMLAFVCNMQAMPLHTLTNLPLAAPVR